MNWINTEALLEKLLTHIINQYPGWTAGGIFLIALMALGLVTQLVMLTNNVITIPVELVKKSIQHRD